MPVHIENLSLAELRELQEKVAARIAQKEVEEKAQVRAELEELARSRGFDLRSLVGDGAGKKPVKKAAPKYRNPANAEETWTGRGRKPKWVVEALDMGQSLEDLAI